MTPPCSKKIKKQDGISGGSVPIFSSNTTNNGIVGYCNLEPHWKVSIDIPRYLVFGDHTRTFNIAECDFCVADNVKVLVPKIKMCTRDLLYIITVWKKAIPNLGYSRHWSVAKKVKLNLPVTSAGEIDFAFMQARIQEMEQARIQEMDSYLKVAGFENCELTDEERIAISSLSKIQFQSCKIGALFNVDTGRDVIIGRVEDGNVPLISHQHDDNGISKRIKQLTYRTLFDYTKTIALADRGVFYATTQAENFHIGTRVKALTFKNDSQDESVRLFFVAAINKLQILFKDYLVNATDKLPTLEIKLPITSTGEIDYHFMETYIRAQEKLAIQRVKDWREKEIAATKEVVN